MNQFLVSGESLRDMASWTLPRAHSVSEKSQVAWPSLILCSRLGDSKASDETCLCLDLFSEIPGNWMASRCPLMERLRMLASRQRNTVALLHILQNIWTLQNLMRILSVAPHALIYCSTMCRRNGGPFLVYCFGLI